MDFFLNVRHSDNASLKHYHTKIIDANVKIMERSIMSEKYCSVEAHVEEKNIDQESVGIINQWCEFINESIPIKVDLIIYLTSPQESLKRMKGRNREEEEQITIV